MNVLDAREVDIEEAIDILIQSYNSRNDIKINIEESFETIQKLGANYLESLKVIIERKS